ncbi:hypothetical protein [Streptomyces anulatus]|uniref:hypothetical protein n=1 Tax=Streptomyces anulatus TaxID=1892 RepID=UPI00386AB140|nr:hypothetical protein OG238_28405 [Streptomyces anulatus]WSU31817.1 hypothetical protein OG391_26975 [Streptomyces anulatus]WSU89335.1 hypothetical protein OG575_11955 [Streptomyces anulatus]
MPIPPRARARALPVASGRGAARCTEGEGPDGVDEPDGRALWDDCDGWDGWDG